MKLCLCVGILESHLCMGTQLHIESQGELTGETCSPTKRLCKNDRGHKKFPQIVDPINNGSVSSLLRHFTYYSYASSKSKSSASSI